MPFPIRTLEGARVFAPRACVWLVAFSVLVFQPGGLFRFTWIKVVWLLLAIGVGALVRTGGRLPQRIQWALWAIVVLLAVAMAFSANPLASFLGRWPRFEGALVIAPYFAVFALGAKILGGRGRARNWATFRIALTPVVVIVSIISAFEAAGFRPLGGAADLRPGATLGNATDQGIIGVLAAAVLALPALRGRNWPARIGLAAAVLTTVLSGSRAGLLGLAAVVLVLAAAAIRPLGRTRAAAAGGASLIVLGVAAVAIPAARERLFSSDTVNGRWLLWDESLKLIAHHPWTGVGPNSFVDAITGFHTLEWAVRVGATFPPDSPHSWLLQAAAVGGLPLLLGAALLAFLIFRSARDSIRTTEAGAGRDNLTGALAAVLAYGLMLLTAFTSPATTPLAAFICGGLVSTSRAAVPKVRPPAKAAPAVRTWESFPAGAVATGLLVALGLGIAVPAAIAEWPMAEAASAVAAGDLTTAESKFQRAYGLRPWDSDTALLAAQAFAGPAADGDAIAANRAIEWARISLDRTPGSSEAALALAIGYINSGSLQQGKDTLDHIIERSPFDSAAYIQRGVANFGLGHVQDSLADLAAAADRAPDSAEPWTILARIYDRLGDPEAAGQAQARADALGVR
ncbi:O-antigen ligase family protein [Arthrobacter sp. ok362]|uniref:O-antigen ligase family protein n=1 Tax=Arthrobacter sp. ok362 TaxID=1761745 RepID=UPI00088360A1|nr:O-antigen ligase family protein [Arthrobacter sp. ok362]SDL78294.1 O-antigen ligase [Arthrobacter sp. ok362]